MLFQSSEKIAIAPSGTTQAFVRVKVIVGSKDDGIHHKIDDAAFSGVVFREFSSQKFLIIPIFVLIGIVVLNRSKRNEINVESLQPNIFLKKRLKDLLF